MMAMFVVDMAIQAQIVVVTRGAGYERLLRQDIDTTVAGAGRLFFACYWLLLVGVSSRNFTVLLDLDLGRDALSGAVDDRTVLHEALDHPVATSWAVDTGVDAGRAEIIVPIITNTAVEMLVLHWVIAIVAIDYPRSAGLSWLGTERQISVVWSIRHVAEETLSCCE